MRMRTEGDMRWPRVQVQIVTYNSADCLKACIESVLLQEPDIYACLIIDNGSEDESEKLATSFGSPVQVLSLGKNVGYSGAHNIGFRRAIDQQADFVLTLNPDCVLEPGYIWDGVTACQEDLHCGGVSGRLLRPSSLDTGVIIDSAGLTMCRFFHVRDRGAGLQDANAFLKPEAVWGVCGAAAIYKVSMLVDLISKSQVLDESFFIYKEDVDLCWRARRRGWYFKYQPTALARHGRAWSRGSRMSATAMAHSFANQVTLLIRHAPGLSLGLTMAVLVELIRWCSLLARKPNVAIMAIQHIGEIWGFQWSERRRLSYEDRVEEAELRGICHPSHV